MQRKPLISIITVCFNSAKTIERTLQSVADQDWKNVQHIIIDGDSNDGTLDILRACKFCLAGIVSEPDVGIYDAMNKGLRLASGDIIGILNSDDVYSGNSVLSKVAFLFETQKLDAIYGDLVYFHPKYPDRVVRTYRSEGFNVRKLERGIIPAHPTLFLRNSVYQKFGLFDTTFKIAGDFDFIARIFKSNELNFRYIPEVLVRMQIGGVSTNGFLSRITLLKENLRACRNNGIPTNYLKLISRYPGKLLEYFFHG
jgi:glycosyltransferase involved in cell wall biosynthesis